MSRATHVEHEVKAEPGVQPDRPKAGRLVNSTLGDKQVSFLKKFFGGKKSFASVLVSTQNKIFSIYGVTQPSDAQKMKASFYLCISGIAILNDLGGGRLRDVIDMLVEETKELTKPLRMRVGELSNGADQLKKIISDFPNELHITESTTVNGLAAFEALYFSMGEELMNDILRHNKGPLGTPGYAAIVVADGIFGEGKARQNFMEVSMELVSFTKELADVIRTS